MDPLIQTVSQTVAQDLRELVHASQLPDPPALLEPEPLGSRWHWHLPLGFVSLTAAGTLLVAAGGVQWQVQEQRHGARRVRTKMHKKKVHPVPHTVARW
jgi:hypothetical protein